MAKQHYLMINIYLSNCRKRFTRTSLLLLFLLCSTIVSAQQVVVTLQETGTLSTAIGDNKSTITSLKVSGPINSTDITLLADMAKNGTLSVLDLSGATADKVDLIGESAFNQCTKLTSISLPKNVESIGVSAFLDCPSLTSITIPNSVKIIDVSAFADCSNLKSVTIGKSVKSIGEYVFYNCTSLAEVILLGDALPGCEYYTFYGIPDDATLYCPIGLGTDFGKDAPWSSFKTIEASVVSLASDERLSKYITDDNKSTITKLRVYGEINSEDLVLLKDMSKDGTLSVLDLSGATAKEESLIESYAFYGCTKLTSISLPKNVTSIGSIAFGFCSSLKDITIPDEVESIGNHAFYYCTSLKDITIPDEVESIGNYAFYCCTSLKDITIPNSVTTISENAFSICSSLTSVTIPNSVTSIGECAFSDCSNLTSVTIGKSVESIGECAFDGCSSLTSVTIPSLVTNIGNSAFSGCSSLTSVTIGKSVESIGASAFQNCSKLEEVTLRGKSLPTTCSSDAFSGISSIANLYCRKVLLDAWKDKEPWSTSSLFTNRTAKDFSITIPECGYATGCFYDDLDFTGLDESKGIYAYIVSAFSPKENTVLLTRAKKIPAETGFVVYGTPDTYDIPATTTDYVYSNMLVSVVDKTTISQTEDDYTNYVLRKDAEGNVAFVLVPANETVTISDYKAYLQVPTSAVSASNNPAEAKTTLSLSFDDDDDTTGISEIKEQHDRTSGEIVIYNLNGQRKQSLTKGLNIVNGKKIFIK